MWAPVALALPLPLALSHRSAFHICTDLQQPHYERVQLYLLVLLALC
jgi:hypothetical protein